MKPIPMVKSEFMTLAWVLRKIDYFRSLSPDQVEDLFGGILLGEFQPGEVICKQGAPGDAMYILKSGRLGITTKKGWLMFAKVAQLGVISPGEVFGEMALLFSQPRTATISATEVSHVYTLPQVDFWRALDRSPTLNEEVRKVADRRKRMP